MKQFIKSSLGEHHPADADPPGPWLEQKPFQTHRCVLTENGRTAMTAIIMALKSNTKQLNPLAA